MDPNGSGVAVQQTAAPVVQGDIPVEVREYLEDLIKQANIPVYDAETKNQIIDDLFDRLDKYIAMKIAENLTEEETEQFIALNEQGKPQEEIDAFIAEHIPDASAVFEQAFIDFRDFYLTAQSNFEEVAKAGNPR